MTPDDARRPRMRRSVRDRTERGATLLEMVMVVGIAATIMLPLLAWMVTGIRAAESSERASEDGFSISLVTRYFGGDIGSAWNIELPGTDCSGGPGSGGQVIVSTIRTNPTGDTERVAYSVTQQAGTAVLVRRMCGTNNVTTASSELAVGVTRPAAGWPAMIRCTERPDLRIGPCTQVELTLTGRTGRPATFNAVMRIGAPR